MNDYIGQNIKVVLFDHDDTLVGTIGPKWDEHKFIAQTYYDKHLTDAEIREHWGKPLNELVCLLYGTDDAEQAIVYNVTHHEQYPKKLFSHTIPVLTSLHKQGKKIGVITATNRFSFDYDLDSLQIPRELFDFTQTADETSYHKPNPKVFDPMLIWLKDNNIRADEVIYIGDGLHDMKAAIGAGFQFLGVETGLVNKKQFEEVQAISVPTAGHLIRL